jgi:hypothetical protein
VGAVKTFMFPSVFFISTIVLLACDCTTPESVDAAVAAAVLSLLSLTPPPTWPTTSISTFTG